MGISDATSTRIACFPWSIPSCTSCLPTGCGLPRGSSTNWELWTLLEVDLCIWLEDHQVLIMSLTLMHQPLKMSLIAFVAAWMLGPRLGRWDIEGDPPMGSPTNALVGLFMLWWGWLAFNSGSTFGVTGNKWRFAAKATCTTMVNGLLRTLVRL